MNYCCSLGTTINYANTGTKYHLDMYINKIGTISKIAFVQVHHTRFLGTQQIMHLTYMGLNQLCN